MNRRHMRLEVFIRGYPDIKRNRHIRLGSRFKTHIEINLIDIKKAEMTWMTQMNSSGDLPKSNLTDILDWEADSKQI